MSSRQAVETPERVRAEIDQPRTDEKQLRAWLNEILGRRPAVGFALGVIRNGRLDFFHGHGVADIASFTPITEDTVFRIASLTKTFTAIAVMQLWEQGMLDLDAPANQYLRTYQLTPAKPGIRPPTIRHLLTHTAGIPEVIHVSDLLHPDWGPFDARPGRYSVKIGASLPSLAQYYRGHLQVVAEPGTAFAYTNHGYATLGQIVEDVSGLPLARYFRERIFQPLGMADTDLVRSERLASRLATGYVLAPRGPKAVPDREWIGAGADGIYSTTHDMARYVAALRGGGANEHGSVLKPATLATMFETHFQPDSRLPGIGLGFFRHDADGHRIVGHEGILPGFNSVSLVAPDDGVGLIGFTNGSRGAMAWLPFELGRLLHRVLGVPDEGVRSDVAHHPEIWADLCGRYEFPKRVSDLRNRIVLGAGAQVFVRRGRLMVRVLTPIPALYRGLPLQPGDEHDPYVFRLDLSRFGMAKVRVVFDRAVGTGATAMHTDLVSQPISLVRSPSTRRSRVLLPAALGAATAAMVIRRYRSSARQGRAAPGREHATPGRPAAR